MRAFIEQLTAAGQSVLGSAAAATLSMLLAQTCGIENPIYACLAALIATDGSSPQGRYRTLRYVVAALVGTACAVLATFIAKPAMWRIGVGVLSSVLFCRAKFLRASTTMAACVSAIVVSRVEVNSWIQTATILAGIMLGIISAWTVSVVFRVLGLDEAIFCRKRVSNNIVVITSHRPVVFVPAVDQPKRHQK